MRLPGQSIEIPQDNPFKNDALNLKDKIEYLSSFLINLPSPFVIALNGSYSTGKTTFIKILAAYLNTLEVHSLLFNAWENDFIEDPLVAVISHLGLRSSSVTRFK